MVWKKLIKKNKMVMKIKTISELKEILQFNLITYLDGHDDEVLDTICKIVIDTVNNYEVNKK
jgi:hypothetical protein